MQARASRTAAQQGQRQTLFEGSKALALQQLERHAFALSLLPKPCLHPFPPMLLSGIGMVPRNDLSPSYPNPHLLHAPLVLLCRTRVVHGMQAEIPVGVPREQHALILSGRPACDSCHRGLSA